MPRPPRMVIPGLAHHITQRGNYRQKVFYRDEDRKLYLALLQDHSRHYGVAIHGYCLMGNHVHLVATPHDAKGLARLLQRLHSEYARALHVRLRRTGHLWQARYGSVAMDREHLWAAMIYVEQNPVRARLVEEPWHWKWSSARAHLCGSDAGWLDLVEWRRQFDGESWKRHLQLGLGDARMQERVREATRNGWPLGSETFLDQLERERSLRVRPSRPGPPAGQAKVVATMVSGQLALFARS